MLEKGQYLIYSFYGICLIDDIQENEILGKRQTYYVFHPLYDNNLKIMIPSTSSMILSRSVISKKEAEKILNNLPKTDLLWFDDNDQRKYSYNKVLKNCDLIEMSMVIKALILKEREAHKNKKYLSINDSKVLDSTKLIFSYEIALALQITPEKVINKIEEMVK